MWRPCLCIHLPVTSDLVSDLIWVKFSIRDTHIMLLNMHEFREVSLWNAILFLWMLLHCIYACTVKPNYFLKVVRNTFIKSVCYVMEYILWNISIPFIHIHVWYYKDWFYHITITSDATYFSRWWPVGFTVWHYILLHNTCLWVSSGR